jgi:ribosome-binding factor A
LPHQESAIICRTIKIVVMQESKRQKQIAGLLNEEFNDIFRRMGLNMIDGGMVSIAGVKITPDLLEARIYLSLFQVKDPKSVLKKFEDRSWEIKKELAGRVKQQLRRIPELKFFLDDTLDNAFKMEELLKQIGKSGDAGEKPGSVE